MNKLYSFRKTKIEDGKRIDYQFVVRKPSREEREMGRVIFAREKFNAIKAGMPTAAMVTKHYSDQGTESILTNKEEKDYIEIQNKLSKRRTELVQLSSQKIGAKKKAESVKNIIDEIQMLQKQLVDYEMIKTSIFNDTADLYARDKAIEYFLISFSMYQKSEIDLADEKAEDDFCELEYLFPGDSLEDKYVSYDAFDKENEFFQGVLNTLIIVCTWYYQGNATSQEEFEELLALSEAE